jgi:isoleucyl-tRNA synthetase
MTESKEPNLDAFIATEHLTRPIISASYVTSSTGTGLVHTAPAHGVEDWQAWRSHCLAQSPRVPFSDVPCAVDGDGKFSNVLQGMIDRPLVERLKGLEVLGAGTAEVIQILKECGTLLEEIKIEHKFPYDWRTKKPVIFR